MSKNLKAEFIREILIHGYGQLLQIAQKYDVEDECIVRTYFYLQGFRDTLKSNKQIEERFKTIEVQREHVVYLMQTLSFYLNHEECYDEILALMNVISDKSKELLDYDAAEFISAPPAKEIKIVENDPLWRKVLRIFVQLNDRIIIISRHPKPVLVSPHTKYRLDYGE